MIAGFDVEAYRIHEASEVMTPALAIYPEMVDANIQTTLRLVGGDANRLRPHVKTAKLLSVMRQWAARGVSHFKCSTTLELLTACEAGAADVLLAYPAVGANARRVCELACDEWGVTAVYDLAADGYATPVPLRITVALAGGSYADTYRAP